MQKDSLVVHIIIDSPIILNFLPVIFQSHIEVNHIVVPDAQILLGDSKYVTVEDLTKLGITYASEVPIDAHVVIYHSLFKGNLDHLAGYRGDAHLVWILWGADYVNFLSSGNRASLYGFHTLNALKELEEAMTLKINRIRRYLKRFKNLLKLCRSKLGVVPASKTLWINSVRKIHSFVLPMQGDYLRVLNEVGISAESVLYNDKFSYYSSSGHREYQEPQNKIMIGHSATPELNHCDVLRALHGCLPRNERISLPLAYGDKAYAKLVTKLAKGLFADRFTTQEEMMSLTDYRRFLFSHHTAIIASKRQMGFGNIVDLLAGGVLLVLDNANSLYDYLLSLGFTIYNLNDYVKILRTKGLPPRLSSETKKLHFDLVAKHFSQQQQVDAYLEIVNKGVAMGSAA